MASSLHREPVRGPVGRRGFLIGAASVALAACATAGPARRPDEPPATYVHVRVLPRDGDPEAAFERELATLPGPRSETVRRGKGLIATVRPYGGADTATVELRREGARWVVRSAYRRAD